MKALLTLLIAITVACGSLYAYSTKDLPAMDMFRNPDRHAELARKIYQIPNEQPCLIDPYPYEKIPQKVINAFIACLASRYFTDDEESFRLSTYVDKFIQLAKRNKLRWDWIALSKMQHFFLERTITLLLDRETVFCAYLNTIYYGKNTYGVAAASHLYFFKSLGDLSITDCATLAAIQPSPEKMKYDWYVESLLARRNWLLKRMYTYKMITRQEYETAIASKLLLNNYSENNSAKS